MPSEPKGLSVAVIGAGLAGALAARVLRECHQVTIYERARAPIEPGAAINIGPNGVQILDTLGFDRKLAGSMAVGTTKVYNHEDKLLVDKSSDYVKEFGADWLFHHRSDLRNEFLRLAQAPSEELRIRGQPARIRWGCAVKNVDPEIGTLLLESGEEVHADLIVGKLPLLVLDQLGSEVYLVE
jgi:salicylate hydroxylase